VPCTVAGQLHCCSPACPHISAIPFPAVQVAEAEVASGGRTPYSGPQASHLLQKKGNPAAFGSFVAFKSAHAARWRQECLRDGNTKPNAAELGKKASAAWAALGDDERQQYKEEAKRRGAIIAAQKGGQAAGRAAFGEGCCYVSVSCAQ